jgi:outer membrane protein assembly factor BamB
MRRRVIIGVMWVVAIAVVVTLYFVLDRGRRDDGLTRDPGESPIYRPEDRAPDERRAGQPVAPIRGGARQFRGNRRHTGRSAYRGPAAANKVWSFSAVGRVQAQPVVAPDGTIYIGTLENRFFAVTPGGTARFDRNLFGPIWSAAAVDSNGHTFVGSDADAFFSFDAEGRTRWRIHTEGDVDSAVSIAGDGTLRFSAGTDLWCVTRDGQARWRFRARDQFFLGGAAIDDDGTAYAGATDDYLYAIAADGRMRWEHLIGGDVTSAPMLADDGTIYVGADDRSVHAIDRDGHERWKVNVGGFVRGSVAQGNDDTILVPTYGPRARVLALDAADGSTRWEFPVAMASSSDSGIASSPLVDVDGNIYFGAHDDYVYSLTPQGQLRWIFATDDRVDGTPILLSDGTLLIGADDGKLYALRD